MKVKTLYICKLITSRFKVLISIGAVYNEDTIKNSPLKVPRKKDEVKKAKRVLDLIKAFKRNKKPDELSRYKLAWKLISPG